MTNVAILLSAYNGEIFIQQQLDSIINQTFTDWVLLVRDDGSTDKTAEIISAYIIKDQRIKILSDNLGHIGAIKSFEILLAEAVKQNYSYIFLSDQDDIWILRKMALSLEKIQALEVKYGQNTPLLAHTDLQVVDKNLKLIAKSFLKQQGKKGLYSDPLAILLFENFVTGCTTVFNRSLLQLALPIPKTLYMHDWWLALVAATFGAIDFIDTSTVLYRQHETNVIGSKNAFLKIIRFIKSPKARINLALEQAKNLLLIKNDIDTIKKTMIESYVNISLLSFTKRLQFLTRLFYHLPIPLAKKIVFFVILLT